VKTPATEQDTARLGKALMKLSFALLLAGAITAGILGAAVWADVTVLYGFLIGSVAAVVKTHLLSSGISKLFQRRRLTGFTEYFISFGAFAIAVLAAWMISRHAFIASICAIAIPYISFVAVLVANPPPVPPKQ
jgi:hypothetical protein